MHGNVEVGNECTLDLDEEIIRDGVPSMCPSDTSSMKYSVCEHIKMFHFT